MHRDFAREYSISQKRMRICCRSLPALEGEKENQNRGQASDFAILNPVEEPTLFSSQIEQIFKFAIFQFIIRNAYHPAALNPMTSPPLPEQIELHRDRMWRRQKTETGVRLAIFDSSFAPSPSLSQRERRRAQA